MLRASLNCQSEDVIDPFLFASCHQLVIDKSAIPRTGIPTWDRASRTTQPETAAVLRLIEDGPGRRRFLDRLQAEISKRSTIDVLRNGIRHGPHVGEKGDRHFLWRPVGGSHAGRRINALGEIFVAVTLVATRRNARTQVIARIPAYPSPERRGQSPFLVPLEVADGMVDAAADLLLGQCGEKALDQVQPRRLVGVKCR